MGFFKKLKKRKEKKRLNKEYEEAPYYLKGRIIFTRNYPGMEYGIGSYGLPEIRSWSSDNFVEVGNFCSIAEGVKILLAPEHNISYNTTYPFYSFLQGLHHPLSKRKSVIIGNDVWIGTDALIMGGVTIGDGAVIGARSVVTKDIEPYSVVVGSPAKHIKFRFDQKIIEKFLKYKWWDLPIEEIGSIRKLLCSEDQKNLFEYLESRNTQ